jgi:hypothetical protein
VSSLALALAHRLVFSGVQTFATLGEDRTVRLYAGKEMTAKDVKYALACLPLLCVHSAKLKPATGPSA